ncbi:endonuclease [Brucella sp. TWI559]
MPMLIIQLAILIAVAFIIGCILGRFAKGRKTVDTSQEDTIIAAALSKPALSEKPEPVATPKAVTVEEPVKDQVEAAAEPVDETVQTVGSKGPEAEAAQAEEITIEDEIVEVADPHRPELLDAPLKAVPDDLTAIHGIGKSVETMLQKLGVFHYAQIAQWNLDQAAWIERHIGFAGRVTRENWIGQAAKLLQSNQRSAAKKRAKPKKSGVKSKAPARAKKTQA